MLAHADPGRDRRLRAASALLVCLLTLATVTAAQHSRAHKHSARAGVVLSSLSGDTQHASPRIDQHGFVGSTPAVVAALVAWPDTADSSTVARSRTGQSPPVRGPPAEALA